MSKFSSQVDLFMWLFFIVLKSSSLVITYYYKCNVHWGGLRQFVVFNPKFLIGEARKNFKERLKAHVRRRLRAHCRRSNTNLNSTDEAKESVEAGVVCLVCRLIFKFMLSTHRTHVSNGRWTKSRSQRLLSFYDLNFGGGFLNESMTSFSVLRQAWHPLFEIVHVLIHT